MRGLVLGHAVHERRHKVDVENQPEVEKMERHAKRDEKMAVEHGEEGKTVGGLVVMRESRDTWH